MNNLAELKTNNILLSHFGTNYSIAYDDKEGRLAQRNQIENYKTFLQEVAGSEKGIMDDINNEGLQEYIVGGSYIRQLFIPKGVTIVSELWNKDRLWIIASGKVNISSELGSEQLNAPYVGLAPYGTKIALYAVEDTLWFAITGVKSENLNEVEKELIAKDYSELVYPWELLETDGEEL